MSATPQGYEDLYGSLVPNALGTQAQSSQRNLNAITMAYGGTPNPTRDGEPPGSAPINMQPGQAGLYGNPSVGGAPNATAPPIAGAHAGPAAPQGDGSKDFASYFSPSAPSPVAGTVDANVSGTAGGFFGGLVGAQQDTPIKLAGSADVSQVAQDRNAVAEQLRNVRQRNYNTFINIPSNAPKALAPGAAPTLAVGPQDQFRAQQLGLAGGLNSVIAGNAPSAAQAQLYAGEQASQKQAIALAKSQPGNPALAMKAALTQNALSNQDTNLAAAQLRAQESAQARGQLGGVLESGRGTDVGIAGQNAQLSAQNQSLGTQVGISNAGLQQQTNQLNVQGQQLSIQNQLALDKQKNELINQYLQMGYSQDEAQQKTQNQINQFNAGLFGQQMLGLKGIGVQSAGQGLQVAGATANAAGSLFSSLADAAAA